MNWTYLANAQLRDINYILQVHKCDLGTFQSQFFLELDQVLHWKGVEPWAPRPAQENPVKTNEQLFITIIKKFPQFVYVHIQTGSMYKHAQGLHIIICTVYIIFYAWIKRHICIMINDCTIWYYHTCTYRYCDRCCGWSMNLTL